MTWNEPGTGSQVFFVEFNQLNPKFCHETLDGAVR